jgi:cbb3-type cytochrome oxidase subunit 1
MELVFWLRTAGIVLAFTGLVLVGFSNILYFKRTKAKPLQRFWLGKELLTRNEYILNRLGFWMAVTGIVAMLTIIVWTLTIIVLMRLRLI